VEAGLVLREMLLRRRVDYIVISSPAAMTTQWQDELAQKFGLGFTIIDRDYLAAVRRNYGFSANPWTVGSRFIISHNLLADETYSDGLAQLLRPFRPRAMLILDEAHHAAPASGIAYATDSHFTVAVRTLAELFEHRLFLSATPHNGHSNSFSSLLEILDPQRFTRGVPVEPHDLEPVMVRRLKSDLLKLGVSKFPVRDVVPIVLKQLPADTPELVLSDLLDKYATWCEEGLHGTALGKAQFVMSGLQQRLLSSIPAFARSLRKHLETLKRHRTQAERAASEGAAVLMATASSDQDFSEEADEDSLLKLVEVQEEEVAEAATASIMPGLQSFDGAIGRVEKMLDIAKANERKSDARVRWLIDWIEQNMFAAPSRWNDHRLIVFTEWEDTRIWLEKRLKEAFGDTDRGDERIATFTGITRQDRREQVKLDFNADPAKKPLRIFLCTDAAREASTCRLGAATSSTSICRGTRRGWSSATDASTASCSRPRLSPAATSSMPSGPRTRSWRRWCARRRRSAASSDRLARCSASASTRSLLPAASPAAWLWRWLATSTPRTAARRSAARAAT
jgi:SNF2 family DNA or RNA helicase